MAISAVTLHVNGGAAATSFTSASFTPANDALLIAWLSARTSAAAIPSVTDSLGNTWTLVPGTNVSAGAGAMKSSLYYWRAPSSPSAMTVTVTSTGAISTGLLVVGYTGSSTDTSNVGVSTNGAGDPAPTLPGGAGASTSTGLVFANFNAGANPTVSPTAVGYSQVVLSVPTTNLRHALYSDAGSPAANPTFTSTATDSSAVVWELKEASAGPTPITGTVAQTLNDAGQDASGTVAAPGVTGTIDQASPAARQLLTGTNLPVSAFQSSAFQASPAFQIPTEVVGSVGYIAQILAPATQAASGTVTAPAITGTIVNVVIGPVAQALSGTVGAPAGITGTVAQTLSPAQQSASGIVAGPGAITGTIAQTAPVAAQSATGTVTAPAVTGTTVQSAPSAQQVAVGIAAAPGEVTGTIVQTAPEPVQAALGTVGAPAGITGTIVQTATSAIQAASGTVSGGVVPIEGRPVGGFAGWSEEQEQAQKRYRRLKRKAEVELREMLEALHRGEEWPPAPVKQVVEALAEAAAEELPFLPDVAALRAQLALLETELRRMLAEQELAQQIAAQRLIEEEAMITLLLVA